MHFKNREHMLPVEACPYCTPLLYESANCFWLYKSPSAQKLHVAWRINVVYCSLDVLPYKIALNHSRISARLDSQFHHGFRQGPPWKSNALWKIENGALYTNNRGPFWYFSSNFNIEPLDVSFSCLNLYCTIVLSNHQY